jgi:hypothetical protein
VDISLRSADWPQPAIFEEVRSDILFAAGAAKTDLPDRTSMRRPIWTTIRMCGLRGCRPLCIICCMAVRKGGWLKNVRSPRNDKLSMPATRGANPTPRPQSPEPDHAMDDAASGTCRQGIWSLRQRASGAGRRRHHARSSLLQSVAVPRGCLPPAGPSLIGAENLFRQPGPPHGPQSSPS